MQPLKRADPAVLATADKPTEPVTFEIHAIGLAFARAPLASNDSFRFVWGDYETPLSTDGARISTVDRGECWAEGRWFIFFCADCYWPAFHAIQSMSFEDAYEIFVDAEGERGHYLIADGDPDYPDDDYGSYTSDGKRIDTECFQGFEVVLTDALAGDPPKRSSRY